MIKIRRTLLGVLFLVKNKLVSVKVIFRLFCYNRNIDLKNRKRK